MTCKIFNALERLRIVATGKEPFGAVYGFHIDAGAELREDRETLANAYIAEHPADENDAVTEEWLRSSGMTEQWYETTWGHPRTGGFDLQIGVCTTTFATLITAGNMTFATRIKAPTRGHVRRLIAALKP